MGISRRQILNALSAAGLSSLLRVRPARAQTGEGVRIDALARAIYLMFPHDRVAGEHYRAAAAHAVARANRDPSTASLLAAGLAALDEHTGAPFETAVRERQTTALSALSGESFFQFVRTAAIESLYRNPDVWAVLGYEGSSIEYGGYVDRGFDDIDWLPQAADAQ